MPKVVIHIEISLDGKVSGFEPDMGIYYRLAETFEPDAMLSGSNTMLAAEMPDPVPEWCFGAAAQFPSCSRMVMAIVDSQGRIRNWAAIRKQPFWKTPLALVSESTPKEYMRYLESENVPYIVAGTEKVDLRSALGQMAERYGTKIVRIDSGGTLSTLMLAQGLVDELSILIHPGIVGPLSPNRLIEDSGLKLENPIRLELLHAEKTENGCVWLRYAIIK